MKHTWEVIGDEWRESTDRNVVFERGSMIGGLLIASPFVATILAVDAIGTVAWYAGIIFYEVTTLRHGQ